MCVHTYITLRLNKRKNRCSVLLQSKQKKCAVFLGWSFFCSFFWNNSKNCRKHEANELESKTNSQWIDKISIKTNCSDFRAICMLHNDWYNRFVLPGGLQIDTKFIFEPKSNLVSKSVVVWCSEVGIVNVFFVCYTWWSVWQRAEKQNANAGLEIQVFIGRLLPYLNLKTEIPDLIWIWPDVIASKFNLSSPVSNLTWIDWFFFGLFVFVVAGF